MNRSDETSTNGAQCAQCCAVISSVCVMLFTQLVTLRSALLRMCLRLCTLFRSLLYHKMFVNFWCRMYCIYTAGSNSTISTVSAKDTWRKGTVSTWLHAVRFSLSSSSAESFTVHSQIHVKEIHHMSCLLSRHTEICIRTIKILASYCSQGNC